MTAAALRARTARAQKDGSDEKSTSINLRVPQWTRVLIDTAAAVVGKSRTEFMLESAREHAVDVLLDRRMFMLDAKQFAALEEVLSKPPRANHELKTLFASKAPWEK